MLHRASWKDDFFRCRPVDLAHLVQLQGGAGQGINVKTVALLTILFAVTLLIACEETNEIVGDVDPTWSPDGTRIAFASDEGGNLDIYVMNADGSERNNLTNSPDEDTEPTWSPDGSRIAFLSRSAQGPDIHVIRPDGAGHANLTDFPASYMHLAWSPDGARIAFASNRDIREPDQAQPAPPGPLQGPLPEARRPEIYVMNADGSNQTRLTFNETFDGNPSWSPDGAKIVFQSKRDGNYEIYVINADGSNQTRLTHNDRADIDPAWSPDGTRIAFASNRPQTEFGTEFGGLAYNIFVMNADGSRQINLWPLQNTRFRPVGQQRDLCSGRRWRSHRFHATHLQPLRHGSRPLQEPHLVT